MALTSVTQTVLVTTIATTVTILGTFLYKKWKQVKIPPKWERRGSVKKLNIFPLKSGHRVELERAEVTFAGLRQSKEDGKAIRLGDRVLVVYGHKDKELRTSTIYPSMLYMHVSVHDDNHFAIDAPTMRTLYVKIPDRKESTVTKVKFWENEEVQAIDCGDEAASWFSRYIIKRDQGLRLGYTKSHLSHYTQLSNKNRATCYSVTQGLSSGLGTVSLINQQSVNDLNKRLGNSSIAPEQFRHNIVIDGPDLQAYEEDNWDWIKIGDNVIFRHVKDCTWNPKQELLRTLERYRTHSGPEKRSGIGNYLEVKKTGLINIGDSVYIAKSEKK